MLKKNIKFLKFDVMQKTAAIAFEMINIQFVTML